MNKEPKKQKNEKNKILSLFSNSSDTSKLAKKDWIIMIILLAIYLIISFYHLGTFKNPQTYYQFTHKGESVGVTLPKVSQNISKLRYYTGPEVGKFTILTSINGKDYTNVTSFESQYPFAWEDVIIRQSFKYMKIVSKTPGSYLGEIQLYNPLEEPLLTKAIDDKSTLIVDEANTVPVKISYINSSYFDEIYFARSAYEYVHGIDTMEWTHPPLGKLIMMVPILLFGMSTFSYRLMGALAGALMIPVIYILSKLIFKNTKWSILAGILMAFDNFHFAHTRMGTVDSFLVLFIMLSALFMYQYISLDKNEKLSKKAKKLFLSGLFMSCSIATKWTGLYAALALAIVFFGDLIYKYADKRKKLHKNLLMKIIMIFIFVVGILPFIIYYGTTLIKDTKLATTLTIKYYIITLLISFIILILKLLKKDKELWKLFACCLIFFIVIPIIIYVMCYVLFPNVYGYENSITGFINQTKNMYDYHANLSQEHPFSSKWYTWPIMIKPVWYYVDSYGGAVKSTIVGIGNPAIWWFGVIAFLYLLISSIFNKKKENLFILIFIACCFIPYIFIDRIMFMYHYFPILPFIMLAIIAPVKKITEKLQNDSFYIFYIALVMSLFCLFYPVTSGMLTTTDYIDSLKWLSSWVF